MTIYKHVKTENKHKPFRFYLIKIENNDYIVCRSKFFKEKDLTFCKFKRIKKLLKRQNTQLFYEFNLSKKKEIFRH